MDDAADRTRLHRLDLTVNHTLITAVNAEYLNTVRNTCAHNGPHRRIHARRVAAACKHANFFHAEALL